MRRIPLGNPITGTVTCTNQTGALFDPDVVRVSFVKDHNRGDASISAIEDTLTYGGSAAHDSQLSRTSIGVYPYFYVTDRTGIWAVSGGWESEGIVSGTTINSYPSEPTLVEVYERENQLIDRPID